LNIEERDKFTKANLLDWVKIQKGLFNVAIPTGCIWTNKTDIITVLKMIGNTKASNHSFLPSGGGLDLLDANISSEFDDCIELNLGTLFYICEPENLQFESFGTDLTWSYFRLNNKNLKPLISDNSQRECFEDLIELTNGEYVSRTEEDNDNDNVMEHFNRCVSRILSGSIVIFSKSSMYNREGGTYDGRHDKMSSIDFRKYIQKCIIGLK
jgi:serine/threonine-protein kinase